jgi:hypothetical protein
MKELIMYHNQLLSFDEFCKFYCKYKKFPDNSYVKKNGKYNDSEFRTKYSRYLASTGKREKKKKEQIAKGRKRSRIDEQWLKFCEDFDKENRKECMFQKLLTDDALKELKKNAGWLIKEIDRAHVLPKSEYKNMKYDPRNVVFLNRYSHNNLDNYKDPVTGKSITVEEHDKIWNLILAACRRDLTIEKLKEISFEKKKKRL